MSDPEPRGTPFHQALEARGSQFVEFAGWLWSTTFGDPVAEHFAVREQAGVWDQSALPKWRVEGPQATEALDFVFTNNIGNLVPGQVKYSPFCDEAGRMVSDATIYKFDSSHYWVLPTLETDLPYVHDLTSRFDVQIESFTGEYGLLDVQGPNSRDILAQLSDRDLAELRYFRFWPDEVNVGGVRCFVSRTGYSGELGYEVLCRPDDADRLYAALLAAGGLTPYGLTAVETLRMESGLLFVGIDYTPRETSPLDLSLDRFISVGKGDFNGREALASAIIDPPKRLCTVVLDTNEPPAYDLPIRADGADVGRLTSVCRSPVFNVVIGLAILSTECADLGRRVLVDTGSASIDATVARLPYHDPERARPRG